MRTRACAKEIVNELQLRSACGQAGVERTESAAVAAARTSGEEKSDHARCGPRVSGDRTADRWRVFVRCVPLLFIVCLSPPPSAVSPVPLRRAC